MKTMPDGTEDTVGTLAVGECFGEMALVDNQPRSATVLAREDCICLKCTRTGVANFQNIAFKLYENLARIIAERYLDMEKQLKLQLKPMCRDVCVAEITKDMPNVAAEIGPRSLLTLSEIGEPYNVPAHGVVVKENAYGQNMYIVLEGELEVRRTVGRETTVLAVLSCGNYFGETALVSVDHGRSADVVAAMDTRLVRLNANHLQKHPDLGALVYRELAKIFSIRLRRSTQVFMRTVGRNCHEDCELLGC
jgi:CRP-like cAMP-binding protein